MSLRARKLFLSCLSLPSRQDKELRTGACVGWDSVLFVSWAGVEEEKKKRSLFPKDSWADVLKMFTG